MGSVAAESCERGINTAATAAPLKSRVGSCKPPASETQRKDVFPFMQGVWAEKAMAPHSSALAWKIPGTEEPGLLQSMGSRRVGHDWSDLAACILRHGRSQTCHLSIYLCIHPSSYVSVCLSIYAWVFPSTHLPMNIQGRFPLGLTGLISLQSKGLSRISNTTVQKH